MLVINSLIKKFYNYSSDQWIYDDLPIELPAKIVAQQGQDYIIEHPNGWPPSQHQVKTYGLDPKKSYWSIYEKSVKDLSSEENFPKGKKMVPTDVLKKYAQFKQTTVRGVECYTCDLWESRKWRKIRNQLEKNNLLKTWEVHNSGFPDAYVLAEVKGGHGNYYIQINMPSQEEEEVEDKEMKMDNDKSFKDQVTSDLEKVAYRQGARKITSVSHAVILHMFRQQGFSESKLKVLLELLESAPGKALLSYGLGKGLERAMPEQEVAQTLAEEFRVSGMDLGVEAGLDKLAAKGLELAPAAMTLMSAIEKTAKNGLTLDSIQEFSKVDSDLPAHVREELNNLEKRGRIDAVIDSSEESYTSELDTQAEEEVELEDEVTQAPRYASCS